MKFSVQQYKEMWGEPLAVEDIFNVFVKFCSGEVPTLPWSDSSLAPESSSIVSELIELNLNGYLTINSQPSVDGVPSSDPIHGWGPKNGFVYQKAYLEFFVAPEKLNAMIERVNQFPNLTFYAVNKSVFSARINEKGDLKHNNSSDDDVNAVTWGVFPGREIIQPTIVEGDSFMAWKDEAFHLWDQWSNLFPSSSVARNVITSVSNSWYLVNIVDNNFKSRTDFSHIFNIGNARLN